MAHPAQGFTEAVQNSIKSSDQHYAVVNGAANETVTTDSGEIPTLRKSLVDNFFFLAPITWDNSTSEVVFNQLRLFTDGGWWYAPTATVFNPIPMGATPHGDSNWVLSMTNHTRIVAPSQYADGIQTTFTTPTNIQVPDAALKVSFDGLTQVPTEDYVCNVDGTITVKDAGADYVLPVGVKVSILL